MPLLVTQDDEAARLGALRECAVMDSAPEPEFDALVAHAAKLARTPIALLSLVDESRQWFKARYGTDTTQTARNISFCGHTIRQRTPLIVSDARVDPRFADNPLVTGDPHIVFYAGWPLVTHDGHALGSLCVIDKVPRTLTASQHDAMTLLARQVVLSLELRRAVARGDEVASPLSDLMQHSARRDAEQAARARLAMLVVHDLKNPLTVIGANATYVLETADLLAAQRDALRDALGAVGQMQAMLLDLLDIERSSSGDGQLVARKQTVALEGLARSVVGRAGASGGSVRFVVQIDPGLSVRGDPTLLTRLLANLVDNARRHAPSRSTVVVAATPADHAVVLSVADVGDGIADADKRRIFERFVQLDAGHRTGRGLGLAFCKLAAEAHGGEIYVEDNRPRGARFCVRIPA